MVGTITFDDVNKIIVAVGGTAGSPIGFVDLYNADIAGSRVLKAPTASPYTGSLTTPVKPCESLALKLNLSITLFSVAGTVILTGKDAWGNSQTENFNIIGNTVLSTYKYYSSIDANGIVASGTYSLAITQPRWGAVWKHALTQYAFDAKLIIGDGSTATAFTDTNKQIVFNDGIVGSWENEIYVRNNAVLTLGTAVNTTLKTTKNGCSIISLDADANHYVIVSGASGTVYLYDSSLTSIAVTAHFQANSSRAWNVKFDQVDPYSCTSACDIFNVEITNVQLNSVGGISMSNPSADTIKIYSCYSALFFYTGIQASVKNVFGVIGASYTMNIWAIELDQYIINGVFDSWHLRWGGSSTGKVYRQYEFDLTVRDEAGNAVSTASVVLLDKNGTQVFSVSTDFNGKIATQTVSYVYYTQAGGDTPTLYSPFTLKVYKQGYRSYFDVALALDHKTVLENVCLKRAW